MKLEINEVIQLEQLRYQYFYFIAGSKQSCCSRVTVVTLGKS